jgi:hypothetical protein
MADMLHPSGLKQSVLSKVESIDVMQDASSENIRIEAAIVGGQNSALV